MKQIPTPRPRPFLIEEPINEEHLKELERCAAIYRHEVERVTNVLAHWQANPPRLLRAKSQRDCEGIAKCNTVAATALAA